LPGLTGQENPLLLCVGNRDALSMDVYSTWNLLCGPLYRKPTGIILVPGSTKKWPGVEFNDDGTQEIHLGDPIVRICASESFDDAKLDTISSVINEWVALDRLNIVNNRAGMHWVIGPLSYKTDHPPYEEGTGSVSFYWHPNNLGTCSANLGRVATALQLIYRHLSETDKAKEPWPDRTAALRDVLRSHWELFDEPVKQFLVQMDLNL